MAHICKKTNNNFNGKFEEILEKQKTKEKSDTKQKNNNTPRKTCVKSNIVCEQSELGKVDKS